MQRNTGYFPTESLEPCGNRLFSRSALNEGYLFRGSLKIRDLGKTVLLIEQNASMALSIADRAYVLELGKVIMEGPGKQLLNDPAVKHAYLGV